VNPLPLAVWIGLSSIFVEVMNWWPKTHYGLLGYLSPLPAFAAMAFPILALIDWCVDWDVSIHQG
jgi:hypothetical protein